MASVTVHQLQSKSKGLTFLNVDEGYGHVDVWGSVYNCPTYLLQIGMEFHIIQFESQEYADEFLSEGTRKYRITKLEAVFGGAIE
jgi:hypothetical protein